MKAKVTAKQLNLRTGPGTTYGIITVFNYGDVLDVQQDVKNNFIGVSKGDFKGYVSKTYIRTVLDVAESQLGVHEEPRGSNWGPEIKEYLNSVGLNTPNPWCISGVYWCAREVYGDAVPFFKSGHVLTTWRKTKKEYKFSKPKVGDIFIMDFGGGAGHAGFVTKVIGNKIETIEFNSNDEGARDGFEVCRKPNGRKISSCIGFIRLF